MPDERDPHELIRLMRAGNEEAAEEAADELFRQCESLIRTYFVVHSIGTRPRRFFDPEDVGQSVMRKLLQQIRADKELDLAGPKWHRYIEKMVEHNLVDKWRREHRWRRDCTRTQGDESLESVEAEGRPPDVTAEQRDLLSKIRPHISDSEWRILNQRAEGQTWREIDREHPDVARIRHFRALEPVRLRFGG
jgi:hypothetical protein